MLLDFGCFYFVDFFVFDIFASDIDEDQNDRQFSSMTLVFEAPGTNVFLQLLFFQIENVLFSAFWLKKAQRYLCYFQPAANQIDHKAGKQNLDQAISPSDGVTCKQGTTKAELSTQCTFAIKMLSK